MSNFKYNITNFEDLLLDVFSDENDLEVSCFYRYYNSNKRIYSNDNLYSFVKKLKKYYKSGDIIEIILESHIQIREKEYNKHIVLSDFFLDRLNIFKKEMSRRHIECNFTIGDGGLYSKIFIDKISVRFDDIIVCTTNNRYSENKFGIFFNSLSENKYSIYSMNTDDKFTFIEIDKNSKHIEDIQNYKYEVKLSVDDYNFEVANEDDGRDIFTLVWDDWGILDDEGVDYLDLDDNLDLDDEGVDDLDLDDNLDLDDEEDIFN